MYLFFFFIDKKKPLEYRSNFNHKKALLCPIPGTLACVESLANIFSCKRGIWYNSYSLINVRTAYPPVKVDNDNRTNIQ